jgi:hypothetical protein
LGSATYFSGAGGLMTTVEDYAQLAMMLVQIIMMQTSTPALRCDFENAAAQAIVK